MINSNHKKMTLYVRASNFTYLYIYIFSRNKRRIINLKTILHYMYIFIQSNDFKKLSIQLRVALNTKNCFYDFSFFLAREHLKSVSPN